MTVYSQLSDQTGALQSEIPFPKFDKATHDSNPGSLSQEFKALATALLCHCTTVPLHHCATAPLCHCTTVSLHYCATALLCHCTIVPLCHCTTALLRHCTTTMGYLHWTCLNSKKIHCRVRCLVQWCRMTAIKR